MDMDSFDLFTQSLSIRLTVHGHTNISTQWLINGNVLHSFINELFIQCIDSLLIKSS